MGIDSRRLAGQTFVVAGTLGLIAVPVVVLVLVPQAYLLLFAGILLAILLVGSAELIEKHTPLSHGWALLLVVLVYLGLVALISWIILPGVIKDLRQLGEQIPERMEQVRDMLKGTRLGQAILSESDEFDMSGLQEQIGEVWKRSLGILSGIMGFLGSAVIILFVGIYLAVLPSSWRWPIRRFLPEGHQPRAIGLAQELYTILWRWLMGRLVDMTMIGVLTWLGLLLLGMPLPLSLGFIAGAFSFIPYIGPVLSVLPAVFVALSEDLSMVLWVIGLYAVIQFLESYLTTPLIQKHAVSLHPVTILLAQVVLGSLFGLLGVALATPLMAVIMTMADSLAPGESGATN